MQELMLNIMLETVAVSLYTIQGFVLAWYCGRFARPRWGNYGIAVAWMVVRVLFSNCWKTEFQPIMTIVKQVLVAAVLYLFVWFFYDTYWKMRVYLCGTYMAVGEICLFLILELNQLLQYAFQGCLWMFEQGKWDYAYTMRAMNVLSFIMQIVINFLYLVIFWRLIRLLTDKFRYKKVKLGNKELAYLLSPALMGWGLGLLFRAMFYTLEDGVPHFLYDYYPILHAFMPLIWITILAGIVSAIVFYQDLVEKNEKQLGMRILEQQLEGMQAQLSEIERVNEANRHMRHDMKNILSVIMNLSGELNENTDSSDIGLNNSSNKRSILIQYLLDVENSIRKTDFLFRTGDSAVDSMLSMKYHEAVRLVPGILYDADEFLLPQDMAIHSFDLCVILGNALDNSIAANQRLYGQDLRMPPKELGSGQPYFIKISSKGKGQIILLEIKNPFTGELRQEPGEEFPVSLKEDAFNHGIGMRNMQRIAERYCGRVSFHSDEHIFILWVTLQNRPPVDSE